MNSFFRGFLNPFTCHVLLAEKVHPSRDALIRCGITFANNVANLVALTNWCGLFLVYTLDSTFGTLKKAVTPQIIQIFRSKVSTMQLDTTARCTHAELDQHSFLTIPYRSVCFSKCY